MAHYLVTARPKAGRLEDLLVQCILESGYALAMIAGWHPNV
jgi:hypothetical protein